LVNFAGEGVSYPATQFGAPGRNLGKLKNGLFVKQFYARKDGERSSTGNIETTAIKSLRELSFAARIYNTEQAYVDTRPVNRSLAAGKFQQTGPVLNCHIDWVVRPDFARDLPVNQNDLSPGSHLREPLVADEDGNVKFFVDFAVRRVGRPAAPFSTFSYTSLDQVSAMVNAIVQRVTVQVITAEVGSNSNAIEGAVGDVGTHWVSHTQDHHSWSELAEVSDGVFANSGYVDKFSRLLNAESAISFLEKNPALIKNEGAFKALLPDLAGFIPSAAIDGDATLRKNVDKFIDIAGSAGLGAGLDLALTTGEQLAIALPAILAVLGPAFWTLIPAATSVAAVLVPVL
jgi:hypothetical protein